MSQILANKKYIFSDEPMSSDVKWNSYNWHNVSHTPPPFPITILMVEYIPFSRKKISKVVILKTNQWHIFCSELVYWCLLDPRGETWYFWILWWMVATKRYYWNIHSCHKLHVLGGSIIQIFKTCLMNGTEIESCLCMLSSCTHP